MTNAEAIFDLEQFALAPIGDGDLHRESVELALSAIREQVEREKGCNWCIGFCPDVTGDIYADYHFCPMCGRRLEAQHE